MAKMVFQRSMNQYDQAVWTSKGGAYVILRREYDMPTRSHAYNVVRAADVDVASPRPYFAQTDQLSEAKDWCVRHATKGAE